MSGEFSLTQTMIPLNSNLIKSLAKGLHGIERESLRINLDGSLALSPHPKALGSPLNNPNLTTDFSESQLELITNPLPSLKETFEELEAWHKKTAHSLGNERMWPFSMPCVLPTVEQIPIAQFGDSPEGKAKSLYREGLAFRYGKAMQTICGVHYNYSFDEEVFQQIPGTKEERMMGMMRNFIRIRWMLTYLLGASPVKHESYSCNKMKDCGKDAVSLRLSRCGYSNPAKIDVSFNDYQSQIRDIKKALETPHEDYAGHGLNSNLLQIPAEYYFSIRLKPILGPLEYVEVRMVDSDPFHPTGVNPQAMYFLHLVLMNCLLREGPPLSKEELEESTQKQQWIALYGQSTQPEDLKEIETFIESLEPLAQALGKKYVDSLTMQPPWKKILKALEEKSFIELGLELAEKHHTFLLS
jgi:glutamate--cysteine ligase